LEGKLGKGKKGGGGATNNVIKGKARGKYRDRREGAHCDHRGLGEVPKKKETTEKGEEN